MLYVMLGGWKSIRDGLHFFGTLSIRKLINYSLIRYSFLISKLTGKARHMGFPASLSVEPTTSCNLRCPECPAGLRQFTRPQGRMNIDLFMEIIDQLKDRLIYLLLYFQGEPMLNPSFFDMVKYASSQGIYTTSSTNGHFLDEENARKIIDSGLDRLIISMDGTDQDTYESYRREGDLNKVIEGVTTLIRLKKLSNTTKPFVILQFIVFKSNEHQLPEIKRLADRLQVGRLEIKTAQVYKYEDDREMIPENPKNARYIRGRNGRWKLKKPIRNKCFRMWSGAVMTWDGRVVPCCFDKDADHQMGKIGERSFIDIWKSEAYRDFRQQILSDRSQIEICRNCSE